MRILFLQKGFLEVEIHEHTFWFAQVENKQEAVLLAFRLKGERCPTVMKNYWSRGIAILLNKIDGGGDVFTRRRLDKDEFMAEVARLGLPSWKGIEKVLDRE